MSIFKCIWARLTCVEPPFRTFSELLVVDDKSTFTPDERRRYDDCIAAHRHAARLGAEDQALFEKMGKRYA